MRKVLEDKTDAAVDTIYTADSNAGIVSGSQQNKLVNETKNQEENEGDPVPFTLSADEAKQFFAGADAILQAILDARTALPATPPAAEATEEA